MVQVATRSAGSMAAFEESGVSRNSREDSVRSATAAPAVLERSAENAFVIQIYTSRQQGVAEKAICRCR